MLRRLALGVLLCAAPPAWAGTAVKVSRAALPAPVGLPAAPVVELRGLLRGALGVPLCALKLEAGLPLHSLDPGKAGILMERLAVLPPQAGGAAPQAEAPAQVSAQEVLVAVNSALRDFPEERLRSMPVEELHGLASSIMDQLGPRSRESSFPAETAAVLSQAKLEKVEERRGSPVTETQLNPYAGGRWPDVRTVKGVPLSVRRLSDEETAQVFRHYTSPAGLAGILSSGRLRNGPMAYMQGALHQVWRIFEDLTGVFLTLPEVRGGEVGVSKSPAYVDVKLPAGLPVLEIEPGRIYLIPLAPRAKDGILKRFLDWLSGGPSSASESKEMRELDGQGGPGPALSVPVEVVAHGSGARP